MSKPDPSRFWMSTNFHVTFPKAMSYLKNMAYTAIKCWKKKPRMLLSIVFYWLLSRWLFSDTILSMIIWLKGHNWEEGIEETVSYYCENRRGYWHGMKKSRDEVIIPWRITKPQWLCEMSDGSKMWLFSSNHTTWDGLIAILQVSKEKKMCTQRRVGRAVWKAWCLYLNSSQSWAMQFGKEASVLKKHNKHTVYLLLQCFINIIYFGRGA